MADIPLHNMGHHANGNGVPDAEKGFNPYHPTNITTPDCEHNPLTAGRGGVVFASPSAHIGKHPLTSHRQV